MNIYTWFLSYFQSFSRKPIRDYFATLVNSCAYGYASCIGLGRDGLAWAGSDRAERAGVARRGSGWSGVSWPGRAWAGMSWRELAWAGLARPGLARAELARAGLIGMTGL